MFPESSKTLLNLSTNEPLPSKKSILKDSPLSPKFCPDNETLEPETNSMSFDFGESVKL